MSKSLAAATLSDAPGTRSPGWQDLWRKEDWWAIWVGLGLVLAAYVLFLQGASLKWIAVTPAKWSTAGQLRADFAHNGVRYVAQFVMWIGVFGVALRAMGYRVREFVPAFGLLYLVSIGIFALGQWSDASRYNLEAPLVALVLGLVISNVLRLPRWLDGAFRVEFYIKIGIVLLGATLPFTLIAWAGPIAIAQASIVSLVTFSVIYLVGRRLGLEPPFAATLGVGGSVCGVSAVIAVSGAVGTRKDDASVAIATVILWAIIMIFVLPFAARYFELPAGVAGAWIGTSEFADAAGLAAAQTYGDLVGSVAGPGGNAEQTLTAFTLMKVVGRDVWIGVWALVLAIIATTRWEQRRPEEELGAAQIWWRFPKFVLGFLAASLLVTWISATYTLAEYNKALVPGLIAPIKDLRTWAFIFCFFSIGLTTRFRDLARGGVKPFLAFSAGVVVNVILGFVLSVWVFASHWRSL